MKVTSVEVDILQVACRTSYSAGGRQVTSNWHVLARVTTADGVQGMATLSHSDRGWRRCRPGDAGTQLPARRHARPRVEAAWSAWPVWATGLALEDSCIMPSRLRYCPVGCRWENAGQPLYRLLGDTASPASPTPAMGYGTVCHSTNWRNRPVAMYRTGIPPSKAPRAMRHARSRGTPGTGGQDRPWARGAYPGRCPQKLAAAAGHAERPRLQEAGITLARRTPYS